MTPNAEQSRAVLVAYQQVMAASWPDLHPEMAARASGWASADAAALERELHGYLRTASAPDCRVRVFWKLTPGYTFGGCNEHFAHDAGLASADLIGIDDFDRRLPWVHQAAKYRADDESVVSDTSTRSRASGLLMVGRAPVIGQMMRSTLGSATSASRILRPRQSEDGAPPLSTGLETRR